MSTIEIWIDGQLVATHYTDNRPAAASTHGAPQAPQTPAAAPQTNTETGTPFCSVHGIEKRAPSKYDEGGYYCQAKDPNGPRGYCGWKWKP